jgi:hypothetical protein
VTAGCARDQPKSPWRRTSCVSPRTFVFSRPTHQIWSADRRHKGLLQADKGLRKHAWITRVSTHPGFCGIYQGRPLEAAGQQFVREHRDALKVAVEMRNGPTDALRQTSTSLSLMPATFNRLRVTWETRKMEAQRSRAKGAPQADLLKWARCAGSRKKSARTIDKSPTFG